MKFRYTFKKGNIERLININLINMFIYSKYINDGHEVVKREVFLNGEWCVIL